MRFELDPDAGMRGEFEKQIKRDWYLGAESFADRLMAQISKSKKAPRMEGEQKRFHDGREAKQLFVAALNRLELNEDELRAMPSVKMEKQAVAWLLKSQTTVTVQWIADYLNMRHRTNASRGISRIRKGTDMKTKRLRRKMLQCTG